MREHLTADERAELDDLMFVAGCDPQGLPLPSREIGPRVVEALHTAADQAHRPWAAQILDDIATAGALARWKSWHRRRVVIEVGEGDAKRTVITTKAAAMSVRRTNASTGETYYQSTFWGDMSRDELQQVIDRANSQSDAEMRTAAVARTVLDLLDRVPEAKTATEAAAAIGTTVEDWLADPEGRAA
jgi:hypothetical protein